MDKVDALVSIAKKLYKEHPELFDGSADYNELKRSIQDELFLDPDDASKQALNKLEQNTYKNLYADYKKANLPLVVLEHNIDYLLEIKEGIADSLYYSSNHHQWLRIKYGKRYFDHSEAHLHKLGIDLDDTHITKRKCRKLKKQLLEDERYSLEPRLKHRDVLIRRLDTVISLFLGPSKYEAFMFDYYPDKDFIDRMQEEFGIKISTDAFTLRDRDNLCGDVLERGLFASYLKREMEPFNIKKAELDFISFVFTLPMSKQNIDANKIILANAPETVDYSSVILSTIKAGYKDIARQYISALSDEHKLKLKKKLINGGDSDEKTKIQHA